MKRTTTLALGTVLLTTGCLDLGLADNVPEEESEMAPPMELVAAVTAPSSDRTLIVDSRQWVPAGRPMALRPEELRPVGSAMGRTAYARSWDQRPYDELFTRVDAPADPLALEPREWQRYVPVLGGGSARGAAPADRGEADAADAGEAGH